MAQMHQAIAVATEKIIIMKELHKYNWIELMMLTEHPFRLKGRGAWAEPLHSMASSLILQSYRHTKDASLKSLNSIIIKSTSFFMLFQCITNYDSFHFVVDLTWPFH